MGTKAEPAFWAIMLGMGSLGLVGLAGCALPDYQPPPDNVTTSVGGASASSSSSGEASTSSSGGGQGGSGGGASSSSSSSSSSSTSSSGNASSSSSSSSSTSGGETVETNCTNGVDDDLDGHADCADGDCNAGYECVPQKPVGWAGLFRVRVADVGSDPLNCPDGQAPAQTLHSEPSPSECNPCTCNPDAKCGPYGINSFPTNQCGIPAGPPLFPPAGSNCISSQFAGGTYVKSVSPQPMGATCAGTMGTQVQPEPWQKYVEVCAPMPTGKGCGAGEVCAPKSNPDFGNGTCVAFSGVAQCPSGFGQAIIASNGFTDARSCSACSCNPSLISCTGGGISFDSSPQCGGVNTPIPLEKCTPVDPANGNPTFEVSPAMPTLPPGSCIQGQPQGEVMNDMPVTICCAG